MRNFKKHFNKKMKGYNVHSIHLAKLSFLALILLILNIWPAAMAWVANTHWGWFLAAFIIFGFISFKHLYPCYCSK